MPIKARDFADVAKSLLTTGAAAQSEACDRTIVGRAYYSAFLAVREAVRTRYSNPNFDVEHADLRRALEASTDPDVADVGMRLKTLFKLRRVSDYEMSKSVSRLQVTLMVSSAQDVLDAVSIITPKIPLGIPSA